MTTYEHVKKLIAVGYTNKQISEIVGLDDGTVRNIVTEIYRREFKKDVGPQNYRVLLALKEHGLLERNSDLIREHSQEA